jgi:lysophospholipase L1-like esterase
LLLSPPPIGTTTLTYPDSSNLKLDSVNVIISDLSQKYHCLYIDINDDIKKQGSPNPTNVSLLNNAANTPAHPDGLHLTKYGAKFIANDVFAYLKAKNKLNYYKVVCFGDSLTFGLYLKGAGTAKYDTYPAYLSTLLNSL